MNSFTAYWSIIAITLPIFVIPEENIMLRHVRDLLFISACFGSLILFNWKNNQPKLVYAFFAISTLSFFNQHSHKSPDLVIKWVCLNLGMILILQMTCCLRKSISYALALVCVTQVIWILFEIFGINFFGLLANFDPSYAWSADGTDIFQISGLRLLWANYDTSYVIGSLNNLTLAGALIAVTSPFLLSKQFIIFLPLAAYCVYRTESTVSIISMTIGLVVYALISVKSKLKYWMGLIIFLPIIGWLIYPKHAFFSFSGRLAAWETILGFIKWPDIFIGKGLNYLAYTYRTSFETSHLPFFAHAHNEILEVYVAFGFFGLILCGYLLIKMLSFRKDAIVWASFTAFLVNACASFPAHISPIALVGVICFSLIWQDKDNKFMFVSKRLL